jgi:hypothetical protein
MNAGGIGIGPAGINPGGMGIGPAGMKLGGMGIGPAGMKAVGGIGMGPAGINAGGMGIGPAGINAGGMGIGPAGIAFAVHAETTSNPSMTTLRIFIVLVRIGISFLAEAIRPTTCQGKRNPNGSWNLQQKYHSE